MYKGQLKGETGSFPSNFVEELPPSFVPSSVPTADVNNSPLLPYLRFTMTSPFCPFLEREGQLPTSMKSLPSYVCR